MKNIGVINIILIILGSWLIWNGFNVHSKNEKLVKEASKVKDVSAEKIDKKNEGKIVSVNGKIKIDHNLSDDTLGINIEALKLKRVVEMYQWEEDCDEKCTYEKVWSDEVIDSSDFEEEHKNPETMPYETKEYIYSGKMGEFEIPSELISKLPYEKTIPLEVLQGKYNNYGNLNIDGSYLRNYSEKPKIGDFRISYKYTENDEITVLGVQKESTIKSYKSKNGKELYDIRKGNYSGKEMLKKHVKTSNNGRIFSTIIGGIILLIGISPIIPKKGNQT